MPNAREIQNIAIALACVSSGLFTLLDSIVKSLSRSIDPGYILEIFGIIGFVITWIYYRRTSNSRRFPSRSLIVLHAARAILLSLSTYLLYSAYQDYGLVDIAVIWLCAPLLAVVLAHVFLREDVPFLQWVALCFGSISLVTIAIFQNKSVSYSSLFVVGGGFSYAIVLFLSRYLIVRDGVVSVLLSFYVALIVLFSYSIPQLYTVDMALLSILLSASLIQAIAQILLSEAFKRAQVAVVAPFEYTTVLWAVPMSWFFFQDTPSTLTAAVAALVIGANLSIIWTRSHSSS
jgi:drug/metabolite transporter (DMT)-like permease